MLAVPFAAFVILQIVWMIAALPLLIWPMVYLPFITAFVFVLILACGAAISGCFGLVASPHSETMAFFALLGFTMGLDYAIWAGAEVYSGISYARAVQIPYWSRNAFLASCAWLDSHGSVAGFFYSLF